MYVDTQRAFNRVHRRRPARGPVETRAINLGLNQSERIGFALIFIVGALLIVMRRDHEWTNKTGAGVIGIGIAALIGNAFGVV